MRSSLVAVLVALSVPACTGDITGVGGDDTSATCGNGMIEGNEQCDDSNLVNGDGCSATCATETSSPHVAASVDKTSVATDLGVETTITVTATGSSGFAGDVTVAVTAADGAQVPITDWSTTLGSATLTLAQNGTQTTTLKLIAMGNTVALTGDVKVTLTSTAAPAEATFSVAFNPVFDVMFTDNGAGTAVYPTGHGIASPYLVKVGRRLAVYNGSNTKILVVHSDGIAGFPHEGSSPGTAPAAAYMGSGNLTTVDDETPFYCHNDTGTTTELINPGQPYAYVKVVQ